MSFNASDAIAEIEAVLGPIEDFFAKHSTGTTQVVAVTAEEFTPLLGSIVTSLFAAGAKTPSITPPAKTP